MECYTFKNHWEWNKKKLNDLFLNTWYANVENSNNSSFYKLFKHKFEIEKYLSSPPSSLLYSKIRFRTRNHRLPIEIGNWAKIPVNQRLCNSCNKLGDEFHYLLECQNFTNERRTFIKPYYFRRPNTLKLSQLMQSQNKSEQLKLSKFINHILKHT